MFDPPLVTTQRPKRVVVQMVKRQALTKTKADLNKRVRMPAAFECRYNVFCKLLRLVRANNSMQR